MFLPPTKPKASQNNYLVKLQGSSCSCAWRSSWVSSSPTLADMLHAYMYISCAHVLEVKSVNRWRGYALGLTIILMCPSQTADVIDTIPIENGFDSGVDADPKVEPNVIPAEAEKVCSSRCFAYLYRSFILILLPHLSGRYIWLDIHCNGSGNHWRSHYRPYV